MEELLRAIEELKRAYTASGVKSVKVELGKDTMIQVDGAQRQLPITNGEWLRSLSDEELAHQIWLLCHIDVGTHWLCDEVGKEGCDRVMGRCKQCRITWLRAEHKGVE